MLIGMAALLGADSANAAIIPTLVAGSPQALSNGTFRYTYDVYLNPVATITPGDSFTIFDFAGYIANSSDSMADIALGFGFTFQGRATSTRSRRRTAPTS
jgi:hypothetical protein